MHIDFHFEKKVSIRNRTELKKFILQIFKNEKINLVSLSVVFCSDEYLLQINRDFLAHNYYTDIITFNYASNKEPVIGEIFLSVDRVAENAIEFKTTKREELHRVIFHGVLHLCGYGDKTKKEQTKMRQLENSALKSYFGSTKHSFTVKQ